jgi:hypothetical protein
MKDINENKPPQDMLDSARRFGQGKPSAYTVERVRDYCEKHLCAKPAEIAAALEIHETLVGKAIKAIRLERSHNKKNVDPNVTTVMIDLPKSDNPAEYVLALQSAQTIMHLAGNDSGYRSLGNLVLMVAKGMEAAPPPLQRTLTVVTKKP